MLIFASPFFYEYPISVISQGEDDMPSVMKAISFSCKHLCKQKKIILEKISAEILLTIRGFRLSLCFAP